VRIVTELIARKDATAIAIMIQEAKEVKTMLSISSFVTSFSTRSIGNAKSKYSFVMSFKF